MNYRKDLKEKYPQFVATQQQKELTDIKQAREILCDDYCIYHRSMQNLILEDTKPYDKEELANIGFVLSTRPAQAWLHLKKDSVT